LLFSCSLLITSAASRYMITHVRDLLINLIAPFIDKVLGPTRTIQPPYSKLHIAINDHNQMV
jgi:hypothetical protein